jgi:hypothetical protein
MVQFECLVREGQDLKLTLITTFPITSTRIINDQRKEAICLEEYVGIVLELFEKSARIGS